MAGTALGIQFNLNDDEKSLDSTYEVVGTSDNYSFQYKLGKGSDLAGVAGGEVQKSISLKGNYGDFVVRVFAVSDIGVRSEFLETGISISPPRLGGTFSFSEIDITNVPSDVTPFERIQELPSSSGGLTVLHEYFGRSLKVGWALCPPVGHAKEGQSLREELISDNLLSNFSITLKNGAEGSVVSSSSLDSSVGLERFLGTSEVSASLQNYTGFSLEISNVAFEELGIERDFTLEVVSHDYFGQTATGTISGQNRAPSPNSFTNTLNANLMSMSWSNNDIDHAGTNIEYLSVPSGVALYSGNSLSASVSHLQSLRDSPDWARHTNYRVGDQAYYNGEVHLCKLGYIYSENPHVNPQDETYWQSQGPRVDFDYESEEVVGSSFSLLQDWARCYYYTFQPSDVYGTGLIYNLTREVDDGGTEGVGGLLSSPTGAEDSPLAKYMTDIRIANLSFRERKDDLVFSWSILDQEDNSVDLNEFKFASDRREGSSILGISGSLFDSDSNVFLTGITEGGTTDIWRTPYISAENITSFEYTRAINNQIYGTGGWPTTTVWNAATAYNSGDYVVPPDGDLEIYLYRPWTEETPPYVLPTWEEWSVSGQASSDYLYKDTSPYSDLVLWDGSIYSATGDNSSGEGVLGVDIDPLSGIYNEFLDYSSGNMVVSPSSHDIKIYSLSNSYSAGVMALFSGSIYESRSSHSQVFPNSSTGTDFWRVVSPFSSSSAEIYFCTGTNGPSTSTSLPSTGLDHWASISPASDYLTGWTMVVPPYHLDDNELVHSDWSRELEFNTGDFVVYNNNIWSGVQDSGPLTSAGVQVPTHGVSTYWSAETGSDIITSHQAGDRVYYNDAVFICTTNNPTGAPFSAVEGTGESILSNRVDSQWFPLWTRMTGFSDKVFRHIGVKESGKRDVGLELAIVMSDGQTISHEKIIGTNPEPSIMAAGFRVDSKSETTKVKFNFNYAFAMQEKTTKVELYRSSSPGFSILDSSGFAGAEAPTFVQSYLGAGEDTFGSNITQITDSPPIPRIDGEGDKVTGYYYKILPYDDFGSGDLYSVDNNYGADEQVLVYPKNYSTSNPDGLPGPVYQQSAGDLPGVVVNLNGEVAFENYFLNWEVPFSGDKTLVGVGNHGLDKRANNISHYEVWQSPQDFLDLGSLGIHLTQEANTGGYRRIIGDIADTGPIPTELQDPGSGITNAENILNVSAISPSVQITHRGSTNDKRYFWVRAVDHGGNKGPFTGINPSTGPDIEGMELILGQAATTDIADFEQNLTQTFPNTIALVPNNPFSNNTSSPGEISWDRHFLYNNGVGYVVDSSSDVTDSYVYWTGSAVALTEFQKTGALADGGLGLTGAGGGALTSDINNPLRSLTFSGSYDTVNYHPAGEGIEGDLALGGDGEHEKSSVLNLNLPSPDREKDFIIARNSAGIAVPMWHAFANAMIGTAHIKDAAITNALIHNMTADKIRSEKIYGQDIQIGGDVSSGQIRSADFGGTSAPFHGLEHVGRGFAISGDGSFVFKGQDGKLFLENDTLTIHGKLRQTDGTELTLLAVRAEPNVFDYNELADGTFTPDPSNQTSNVFARFQNSDVGASDVRFKMERGNDGHEVFSYADYPGLAVGISGFSYNTSDFNTSTKEALALFNVTGFDSIISGGVGVNSVVVYASGIGASTEHSATIYINSDGRQGETGRSPLFRGAWKPSTQYSGAYSADGLSPKLRGDVVYEVHGDSNYWICLKDHESDASAVNFSVDVGKGYWDSFGAEFESVATDLLLSKDVIITDTLTMGTYDPDNIHQGDGGTIQSAGITWSPSDMYPTNIHGGDPSGFILTNDGGNPKFWIGSGSRSFLSYDGTGQKLKMAGAFINNTVVDGNLDDTISDLASNNSDPLAIFIGGGYNNDVRMIDGGYGYDSVASSIVGGASGMIQGRFSFIGNGFNNQCFDNFSAIVGGYSNSMPIATSDNAGGNLIGCGTSGIIAGGSNDSILGGAGNLIASGDESSVLAGINCKITKPHDPGVGLDIFTSIDSDGESVGRYDTSNYYFAPRLWGSTTNGNPMDFSSYANKWLYSMFPGSGTSVGGFDGWFYAAAVEPVQFGKFNTTKDTLGFDSKWIFHTDMGWVYIESSQFTGQLYSHSEFVGNWVWTDSPTTLSDSWWFFFKDEIYDGTLRSDSVFSSVPAGYVADKGVRAYHDDSATTYPLIAHPSTPASVKYWNGASWVSW